MISLLSIFKNPTLLFKNKRIVSIDLMKLFASLLVVLDHSIQRWIVSGQSSQLYNYIFLTQMPIFMVLAGYFAYKGLQKRYNEKKPGNSLLKSVISYALPFISFGMIRGAFLCNSFIQYIQFLGNMFLYPNNSLWFLWILLIMDFLLRISCHLSNIISFAKKNLIFLLAVCFYIILLLPLTIMLFSGYFYFGIKQLIYYSIYYLAGYIIAFLVNNGLLCFLHNNIYKIVIFFLSLALMILSLLLRPTMIFDDETFINILIRVVGSFSSIYVCYFFANLISRFHIAAVLSKGGIFSLELYFTHLLIFLLPLLDNKIVVNNQIETTLLFISFYVLTITVSYCLIMLFKTNKITDLIFYGKADFFYQKKNL